MTVVRDIVNVYAEHEIAAEVLAASIRHPLHCLAAGAYIATVPFKVLNQMIDHP